MGRRGRKSLGASMAKSGFRALARLSTKRRGAIIKAHNREVVRAGIAALGPAWENMEPAERARFTARIREPGVLRLQRERAEDAIAVKVRAAGGGKRELWRRVVVGKDPVTGATVRRVGAPIKLTRVRRMAARRAHHAAVLRVQEAAGVKYREAQAILRELKLLAKLPPGSRVPAGVGVDLLGWAVVVDPEYVRTPRGVRLRSAESAAQAKRRLSKSRRRRPAKRRRR